MPAGQDKNRYNEKRTKNPNLGCAQQAKPVMVHWDVLCRKVQTHHISSAQRSARVIFDNQLVTLAQHQTDVSNYAYNRRKEIFISSQILCVLYYWW